jgi:hypothetical protein
MRWDREDEFDLADVGGEANATAHGSKITSPRRRPKRLDRTEEGHAIVV